MKHLDQPYTWTPFFGSRRIALALHGLVNRKRAQWLMRLMNLEGVAPTTHTSRPHPTHAISPYLLWDLVIDRANQGWRTDVAYLPMRRSFLFLVAILEWENRYTLAWMASNTPDTDFGRQALEQAFQHSCHEIFKSDQGCQFTSRTFTARLKSAWARISMDARGRAFDNIFNERLWRTVKYAYI